MGFAFTAEQDELRRVVRRFFAERSAEAEVRRLMATEAGYDPAAWSRLSAELGLTGLAVPERLGGAGFGFAEVGVVLEEAGRALLCAPYFSTVVLAATALLRSGDEAARNDYLPGIAAGTTRATLAFTEPSGRWDLEGLTMTAIPDGAAGGWTLSGTKTYVLDGHTADLILVAARTEAGPGLFAVPGSAPGLTRTPLSTMDLTRKQAELDFDRTPARLIGTDGAEGADVLSYVLDVAAAGLALEQLGGAEHVLGMTVEYAKTRMQFGRPIGSFQAVKHKCADMLVDVEQARSAAYHALGAIVADGPDRPAAASLAKALCSDAYLHCAAESIQIHGGIGFTWEHPAHLYFKRAKSSQLLFGHPAYHRGLLATPAGL